MAKFPVGLKTLIHKVFPISGSQKWVTQTIAGVAVVLIILLLPLLMQYLHLLDIHEVKNWMDLFPGPQKVNTVMVVLLLLVFYTLFNSISYGLAALIMFLTVFCIADMQKMRILHQPLLPGDLFFFKQALLVTRLYTSGLVLGALLLPAIGTVLFIFRRKLLHCRLPWRPRVVVIMLVAGLLFSTAVNLRTIICSVNHYYRIVDEFWNQLSNYRKNGVLYAFLMNIETLRVNRPPYYSKETIDSVFARYTAPVGIDSRSFGKRPDVIIYMNESFWDITGIKAVKPPRDPIPEFHSLVKKKQSMTLYSPVFGGNTCDAEFEVLTGMTNSYFPPGARAYNQFIQRPTPSLVRVFKENGYRTTAIHTFKRWFWNRGNVYRHLGFDSFISMEDMETPEKKGMYIGDAELARQVIRRLDADTVPQFIFALSMQNHGPYDEHRYDTLDCPVATGLSSPADREYNTYMQGIADADRSLKQLTHYIKWAKRPTIIFFFGDHLPGFTHVYKETGCEQRIKEFQPWAYASRCVWYSNRRFPKQKDTALSMVFLPLEVARMANLTTPPYYRFLDDLRIRNPVFTGKQEHRARRGRSDVDSPDWLVIYDVLLGKEYSSRYHRIAPWKAATPDTLPAVIDADTLSSRLVRSDAAVPIMRK